MNFDVVLTLEVLFVMLIFIDVYISSGLSVEIVYLNCRYNVNVNCLSNDNFSRLYFRTSFIHMSPL